MNPTRIGIFYKNGWFEFQTDMSKGTIKKMIRDSLSKDNKKESIIFLTTDDQQIIVPINILKKSIIKI